MKHKSQRGTSRKIAQAIVLVMSLLVFCNNISAQSGKVHLRNRMCTLRDTAILFRDSYNQLLIYQEGVKPDDMILKSPDSTLFVYKDFIIGDTQVYTVLGFAKKKSPRLLITNKKDKKLRHLIYFNVRPEVQSYARLGNIDTSFAFRSEIIKQDIIDITSSDPLHNLPLTITDYKFRTYQGKDTISINGYGNAFTTEMKEIVRDLPRGTVVEFTNIYTITPDAKPRRWNNIRLIVR